MDLKIVSCAFMDMSLCFSECVSVCVREGSVGPGELWRGSGGPLLRKRMHTHFFLSPNTNTSHTRLSLLSVHLTLHRWFSIGLPSYPEQQFFIPVWLSCWSQIRKYTEYSKSHKSRKAHLLENLQEQRFHVEKREKLCLCYSTRNWPRKACLPLKHLKWKC